MLSSKFIKSSFKSPSQPKIFAIEGQHFSSENRIIQPSRKREFYGYHTPIGGTLFDCSPLVYKAESMPYTFAVSR